MIITRNSIPFHIFIFFFHFPSNSSERRYEELCRNIINDMNQYGLSVVDDFLGREKGLQILNEVHKMYSAGMFKVRFLII